MFLFNMRPPIMLMCGIALILMGIFFNSSVFLGNPKGLDFVFDSLGVCYIILGARGMWKGDKPDDKDTQ